MGETSHNMQQLIMNIKKKINTSYFAMSKNLPPETIQVGISLIIPGWWQPINRQVESRLAPDKSAFKKDDWKELYQAKMDRLGKSGILQIIVDRIPAGSILLCYEKDPNQCHRSIALKAMIEYCGVEGSELIFPKKEKPVKKVEPRNEQEDLFQ